MKQFFDLTMTPAQAREAARRVIVAILIGQCRKAADTGNIQVIDF